MLLRTNLLAIIYFIPFVILAQGTTNFVIPPSTVSFSQGKSAVQIDNMRLINTPHLEFSPVYYENGIVYVSSVSEEAGRDEAIGEPYFELYYVELSPKGEALPAQNFSPTINTHLHEGPVAFNSDYSKIFFTRNNILNGSVETGKNGFIKMKIFEGEKGEEDWTNIKELSFNSDNYSCIHPTLAQDESKLYFASNMPGGYGGYDLYVSKKEDNEWGKPTNLGPRINTYQNDAFPFLYKDGKFFFASEGHNSQGGYDIFMVNLKDNTPVKNLDAPFNSPSDDLGFNLRMDGKEGFFTSDRENGSGKDDIYKIDAPYGIPGITAAEKLDALITVYDNTTKQAIDQAEIRVFRQAKDGMVANPDYYDTQFQATTDKPEELMIQLNRRAVSQMKAPNLVANLNGTANTQLDVNQRYVILASKEGYAPKETLCSTIDEVRKQVIDIYLDEVKAVAEISSIPETRAVEPMIESLLEPIVEKGSVIILDKIFYDFNKSAIRRGAARDLDVILALMLQHPQMTVELSAHTDSRGDERYNRRLSRKRAESAKNYLVARGIAKNRITAMGYGETQPRNGCVDGIKCTEEEHQYNRRTQIKVMEMGANINIEYTDNPPDKIDRAN